RLFPFLKLHREAGSIVRSSFSLLIPEISDLSNNARLPKISLLSPVPMPLCVIPKSWDCSGIVFVGNAFLSAGRDIVGTGMLKDLLCPFHLVVVFRVHGNENVSLFNFSLVLLGFVLRNTQAN